jgi:hypothetical protein
MLSNLLSLSEASHHGHLDDLTIVGALDEPVQHSTEHKQGNIDDAICNAQPENLHRRSAKLSSVQSYVFWISEVDLVHKVHRRQHHHHATELSHLCRL